MNCHEPPESSITRLCKYEGYILLILSVAFLIRIWGVDFGLPHIYHTDEWNEVKRALKLGAGIIDFERVGKGGYFYLLFVEYGIYFVILKIFGVVRSAGDFLFRFFQDPSHVWMIGRVTTVVIGTFNCVLVYLLGKNAFSRGAGIFAFLLLAVHPLHVRSSHFITVDVPLVTLLTICFLVMYTGPERFPSEKIQYSLLGIFAALALMTKIAAGPVLFSILVFHFLKARSEPVEGSVSRYFLDKRLLLFIFFFSAVYVIGEPGILFQYKKIVNRFFSFFQFSKVSDGGGKGLFWPIVPKLNSPARYYLEVLFPLVQIIPAILFLAGGAMALKTDVSKNLVMMSFVVSYSFFLIASERPELIFPRYVLPFLPIICVYQGLAIDKFLHSISSRIGYRKILTAATLVVVLSPMVRDSVALDMEYTKPDTRTIAKEWVENNISTDRLIYIYGGLLGTSTLTVPLDMNPNQVDQNMARFYNEEKFTGEKGLFYELKKRSLENRKTFNLIPTGNEDFLRDAMNRGEGDFAILTDQEIAPFYYEVNRKNFPEKSKFISWVTSEDFELMKTFGPGSEATGPVIYIYRRKIQ